MNKSSKEEKMDKEKESTEEIVDQEQVNEEVSDSVENAENETKEETIDDVQQWKEKFLRLYSEFENYKRRTLKERMELIQSANERLLTNLLPVLDDFDRAIASMSDNEADKSQLEGTLLIYNKFKQTLEQSGLKPMDAKGTEFNTDYHEAITNMPVEDEKQKGKVIEVVERGYFINEKVLRYAKVVVGA
ncbi:MAG: nucleotide exchange factor GrpE [Bacteroidia bacterium]|nr:nucleotide exchange factor GrpE [Bacteroidia bacterium]